VFSAIKIPVDRWHSRLGHPSSEIVHRVISKNNLPCVQLSSSSQFVCDACACACANAHQLPHPVSTSRASTPLELVFSVVWSLAIDSFYQYYVSFIDDYSKFTWIYLLHHKSKVSKYFLEFQQLVEQMLDCKIIVVQSNWDREYEKLNSFFALLTSLIMFLALTHINKTVQLNMLVLLAHASIPLKYWDETLLAATFLINRTPTKLLLYDTPIRKLLDINPDYSSFRVFGCAYWPNL
jgi:hypothetical protein